MPNATYDYPDLTTFTRLEELGLVAVGQRLTAERAVLECRVVEEDPWCRACGARATSRGTISPGPSPTSRSVTDPRPCWCGSAATSAVTAATAGERTPPLQRPSGRSFLAVRCGGRWRP